MFTDIKHDGKCSRNTHVSPAIAEEFACGDAAYDLLFGKDGNFLGEDEAIFVNQIFSDGDTRGSIKFIER